MGDKRFTFLVNYTHKILDTSIDRSLHTAILTSSQSIDSKLSFLFLDVTVSVPNAICVHAHFYCQGQVSMDNLVHFVIGAALKDDPSDKRRLGHYFDSEISGKAGAHWQALFRQRHLLK